MLSVTEPIQMDSIESVTCLADSHPVFLLEGHSDDKIVVKRESFNGQASPKDIQHNGRVMGVASPNGRAFVAGPSEVKAMEFWAKSQIIGADADEKMAISGFLADIRTPGAWVKMQYHILLDLEHAKNKLAGNDKSEVRLLAKILNASGGMEKLGQVVVCDIFNGNQDRFSFAFPFNANNCYGSGFKAGLDAAHPTRNQYYHLMNLGNIMVTRGKGAAPIGLDSWDPTTYFANWQQTLTTSENLIGEQWMGRLLAPDQAANRRKIAERCVDDLNLVLGVRKRRLRVFSTLRLNKSAAERMARGMETGIAALKNMLKTRYTGRAPQGLRNRGALLGVTL